ncbi:uncharacterized protein PgNI_12224 [Pyricularia grisea]|uniref:Uncharacterized protein n=1 Tax=Pyricularia grisea TaxID=148305 RepID=A0A6P8AQQ9_PYRGI|nr:uncharacterized protein PgNI_12224 [Pyricularia grisea]TLD04376.1 hypothetical protein PgNI_12224 [Pyricularia grisea]
MTPLAVMDYFSIRSEALSAKEDADKAMREADRTAAEAERAAAEAQRAAAEAQRAKSLADEAANVHERVRSEEVEKVKQMLQAAQPVAKLSRQSHRSVVEKVAHFWVYNESAIQISLPVLIELSRSLQEHDWERVEWFPEAILSQRHVLIEKFPLNLSHWVWFCQQHGNFDKLNELEPFLIGLIYEVFAFKLPELTKNLERIHAIRLSDSHFPPPEPVLTAFSGGQGNRKRPRHALSYPAGGSYIGSPSYDIRRTNGISVDDLLQAMPPPTTTITMETARSQVVPRMCPGFVDVQPSTSAEFGAIPNNAGARSVGNGQGQQFTTT